MSGFGQPLQQAPKRRFLVLKDVVQVEKVDPGLQQRRADGSGQLCCDRTGVECDTTEHIAHGCGLKVPVSGRVEVR